MTLFEYMSIATSLLLSFSLARTLTNLAPVFSADRRYWVHIVWVLLLLFNHASLFWQLWLYNGVESWTLVGFVLLLTGPIMLLIAASLLVPVEAPDDYRVYFESIRAPAYLLLIVMQLQQIPLLYLLLEVPLIHPLHLTTAMIVLAFAIGLIGRRRSIDMVLVILFSLSVAGGLLVSNDHQAMREFVESLRD